MKKFIIILLFLFIISPCFAATQLLKTVMPSGGDYTSLEACMNANEQNLVTNDKYFDVKIDGDWSSVDTTIVTVENYTTDTTHYINIYTTSTGRHRGYYDTARYRIEASADIVSAIRVLSSNVTITGVAAKALGTTDTHWNRGITIDNVNVTLDKFIGIAKGYSIQAGEYTGIVVKNSVGISTGSSSGIGLSGKWQDAPAQNVYNSVGVALGTGKGIEGINYGITVKNSYAHSTSGTAYGNSTLTTSASSDTSGSAGLQNIAYSTSSGAYFTNVTAGSEDFHINTGSALIDVGTDLSAIFTDDIDGQTRSGTWDIGADEFVSAVTRRIWTFD